jgi:hypothetical protein
VIEFIDGCDCPEARLLRAVVAELSYGPAGAALDVLAGHIAAQRLRELSHALSTGRSWSPSRGVYDLLDHYDTPPKTAQQVMAEARWSWRHLT